MSSWAFRFSWLLAAPLIAQRLEPVKWSLALDPAVAAPSSKALARIGATIEPGWRLYAMSSPKPSIPTTIRIADNPAVSAGAVYQRKPKVDYDPNFQVDTEKYEHTAEFLVELAVKPDAAEGDAVVTAEVRFTVCDATRCLPPRKHPLSASLRIAKGAPATAIAIPEGFSIPKAPSAASKKSQSRAPLDEGLGRFLAIAFGAGLLAIFTPCVFPMIPITMSYFLNRPDGGGRAGSLFQAAVFCGGIVVLFSLLGLAATATLGPFGVVQLGSSPWVNAVIAAIFLVFGLSLLGAFEITIPSGILTRLDQASQRGGVLGTLVMGLAFSLTSFACVGPFMGPLLAASVQEGGARPVAGMVVFASGLASPFFFLAVFPSYLKKLPKSGGWLARVKVVMGFIVLAAMLKYISSIDQVLQWGFLTRERFLAAWVVLFAMAGLYLLGFLRLEGVNSADPVGLGRLLTGVALLAFSLSLVPGMFGARLGELDAYVPLAEGGKSGLEWRKNDLRGALARAQAEGKRVFVSFTGYACTNCHWMKANMFPRAEIREALNGFVLVELYTDGADGSSEE
ncbi:MAG: cytochrome c biogenesis protein CcdA, partial [Bryobacteraceae bacterium]